MLTGTFITLITLLERLLASGTLTMALSALFKKALLCLVPTRADLTHGLGR
jgi:hypothetical protein